MGKRQEANRKLIKILSKLVEAYSDWRFGQIIFNAGFITRKQNSLDIQDPFYEESTETLNRVKGIVVTDDEETGEE